MAKTPRKTPKKAAKTGGSQAIKVPRSRFGFLGTRAGRYLMLFILVVMLIGAGWAFWKWRSLYFGMPSLPPVAELWDAKRIKDAAKRKENAAAAEMPAAWKEEKA